MKKHLFFILIIQADLAVAESACTSILSHGLRNIAVDQNDSALISAKYSKNCGSDYSNYSKEQLIQAEAEVFGYGSGSADYNEKETKEKLKTWCNQQSKNVNSSSGSLSRSETFYQGAVDAWKRCIELNSDTLKFIPTISADRKTIDIGIVYHGSTTSGISFYGLESEGFTCTAKSTNGSITFPHEVKNEYVSVNCKRSPSKREVLNNQSYEILERGTITIQTAGKPIQLYFLEEYSPTAPTKAINELKKTIEKQQFPIGTVISSVLSESLFYGPANNNFDRKSWVLADGRSVKGSEYHKITGSENAPDLRYLTNSLSILDVNNYVINSGENVSKFESNPENKWFWFVSGRDISGSRHNNDWEQDEDQKQTYLTEDGTVIARGRTLNHKHNKWGAWKSGNANLLSVESKRNGIYYYLKIN
ncbi:hypothetical protein QNS23_000666 [Vibrio parahaemolyticus]|nr:hypothetical protein [Vibrio parahaemolyticus]